MINLPEIVIPELAFDAEAVADQEQLFTLIVNRLLKFGITTDRDILLEGFKKREELCSTGVGHGVALPHAATAAIDRIVVVVVRLNPGLKWQSRDELPVNLIVALVSPPSLYATYLQVLAALARVLRLPAVREAMLSAPTASDAARLLVQFVQEQTREI